MAQTINTNTFFENIHLTDQNSLTHLLDFDERFKTLHLLHVYGVCCKFIQEMNTDSCTIGYLFTQ